MDLISKFDKVYIIHCVENKNRYDNIKFQLDNLITNYKDRIEIYNTCYFPHNNICANAMIFSGKSRYLINGNEFSLTREFYRIIKTSYLLGYDRILIFEDDFSLMKQEYMGAFINAFPDDFDIIQLSYQIPSFLYDFNNIFNQYQNNGKFWIEKEFGGWSNNGLALSRNGMKYWIDRIDNEFQAADIPIHESKNSKLYYGYLNASNKDIKHYIPTIPLIYIDGIESTVQQSNKNDIYELYQYIDKTYYNIYI